MEIRKVWAISFSPTGGTERVCAEIAKALSDRLQAPSEGGSLNGPEARKRVYEFSASDLLVIACPTYAGRLPNKIAPDLRSILRGNRTPAVAVVTFGNRAFDNALAELVMLLSGNGFYPVSAGAFVTRHAFTDALGLRPAILDLWEMRSFAARTAEILLHSDAFPASATVPDSIPASATLSVTVPGDPDAPYYVPKGLDGNPANFLKAKPKVNGRCNQCGACAAMCPTGAINPRDASDVSGICIKCQACVRRCTRQARYFDDPAFLSHVAALERDCVDPKENAVFYATHGILD